MPLTQKRIAININPSTGDIDFDPPSPIDLSGEESAVFSLVQTGPAPATVWAYIGLANHSQLKPDDETMNNGFQDILFPLQDSGKNPLQPTFEKQSADGHVEMAVTVLLPGSAIAQPVQSIVILDW
jgi:hypothetical protein